jgi:hypothetical protein
MQFQLTDAELDQLATQVDEQLMALQRAPGSSLRGVDGAPPDGLPDAPEQRKLIEQQTAQGFPTFWQRYRSHLRADLCKPGGLLYEQWQKYKDVESKSAVRVSYAWLAAMGIPMASIAPVAVAISVFLLNVLVKVGIEAICDEPHVD